MNKYKQLADHLKTLLTSRKQLKSIVYAPNFKHNVAASYSLLSTCLNNINEFQTFKEAVQQRKKTDITNPYLFWVMLAEYINTGSIRGGGKIKRLIVQNVDLLPSGMVKNKQRKINKKKVQIRVRQGVSCEELSQFSKDSNIPNLYQLPYAQYSKLIAIHPEFLKQSGIIVQSKSSCLPAYVLFQGLFDHMNQYDNFDIIDCCAAPGNKTLQLAEYLGDKGTVYAFDKDPKRAELLKKRIQYHGMGNIKVFNQDFLTTDPHSPQFKNVRMILADPSCSGSGMLTNLERDSNTEFNTTQSLTEYEQQRWSTLPIEEQNRIISLQQFQLNILNHCAKYNPVRLVYSTCSIHKQENEQVIALFLKENSSYEIKRIRDMKDVERGNGPIGKHCLRVSPLTKESDGFFVCLLRRISLE